MKRNAIAIGLSAALVGALSACSTPGPAPAPQAEAEPAQKAVVYQMFTRLFGNTKQVNKPWGTLEENGVGKFNDINDAALKGIKELGVSHVWYTGVLHHAVVGDYSQYGISTDDPDVIKGRAGSPYAVKDYYAVNPDMAEDPANRMQEFKALVDRTHNHGMKVLIDIVPNHIARDYVSLGKPEGVEDFGARDDDSVEYARDNNFYYVVGQPFEVPDWEQGYAPLGGEAHPLADGEFAENPAKWTGNGARSAKPNQHDWYETVKVNYGVRPDGSFDFPTLPEGYDKQDLAAHYAFWADKDVPDSWKKFKDIVLFWTEFGIDGFRYDMAEMVPVEFWSYLNSHIKRVNPDAFLLAEVYQPHLYRDYLHKGKMDYLYDKVELYDTLKDIIRGSKTTDAIAPIQAGMADIEHHMLHFLENHDEQRIATPDFAGEPENALPAMVISATLSTSPTMLYFGQDVGERAEVDAGFGKATRTTIFDYWGVEAHQRWMNGGKFDGGQLSEREQALRDYYIKLMQFTRNSSALMGKYAELHTANRDNPGYTNQLFSFARWDNKEQLIVVANFDQNQGTDARFELPAAMVANFGLDDGRYTLVDQIDGSKLTLNVRQGQGQIDLPMAALQSRILLVKAN
ncbi:alpha-amylase family protein [Paraferrimonas sedimenticola]|uniref:O-glycosyl hydrolase family 13 n=1 Tax=Paraferrimonas sedimenticola TaxID=375674 RepID=A0AA37RV96_9GAMM|nr:alpha-amylase family protein [Paraferrimonas sedimenticola]GLP95851.1 O-glycosyl hydrolase family 13 [Paraferrimonas sedimenticola]